MGSIPPTPTADKRAAFTLAVVQKWIGNPLWIHAQVRVLPTTPYCNVTGRRHRVSPCRSAYFASPCWLLTLDLRRRSGEAASLFPESWWHLTMRGSRPSRFMIIPNTKRHPNNTKTDQLPIFEVITGLPRPYLNTYLNYTYCCCITKTCSGMCNTRNNTARKWHGVRVGIDIDLIVVWVVEIDVISEWGIEVDLISV